MIKKYGLFISLILILLVAEIISAQGPKDNEIVIIEEDVIKEYDFNWSNYYQEHKLFPIRPYYEIPEFDGNGRLSRFIELNATSYSLKILKCRWFDLHDFDTENELTFSKVQISSSSSLLKVQYDNVSAGHSLFIGFEINLDSKVMLEHQYELYSVEFWVDNDTVSSIPIMFSLEIRIIVSFRIIYEWYYWYDYYFPSNPTTDINVQVFNILLNPIMIAVTIDIFVVFMIRRDYKKRKQEMMINE